ncbi:MAG: TonB family protein [Balneola sp.]|jgi:TonB family protein
MKNFFDFIQQLGASSADIIWFPLLIWTCVATLVFFFLRMNKSINPLYQYHIRVATLFALPMGLVSAVLLQAFSSLYSSSNLATSVFVVENPLPVIYAASGNFSDAEFSIPWMEANFLIGMISALFLIIAAFMLARLIYSYVQLKKLHSDLTTEPLTNTKFSNGIKDGSVSVAFHDHPLVPFTFGWKSPIIVLPERIKDDSTKLDMAIQHELVHIRRGDYLLQLALSVIQSLFWFHPLIKIGTNEIEIYREISCDQEVLNTSDIHPKKYASMLLELVPLHKGYGSFAVNMAVKQSTLKQRIETMKHHKMHKTSYKRSLFLLLSITLMVIAPIACSDLRGPETLSDEEIMSSEFVFNKASIEINGNEVFKSVKTQKFPGLDGLMIAPANYGTFIISATQFDGASLTGRIDGNRFSAKVNQLDLVLTSESSIFSGDDVNIWIRHFPNKKWDHNVLGTMSYSRIQDAEFLENLTPVDIPSPPKQNNPVDKEVFIVVENMPELIGGQAGVQSKVEYPPTAKRAGIEGRVTVQFVVDKNGNVKNPKIIRGIGGGCDEEALRVVSQAKFKPGMQRGRNVEVEMSLPILFKLSNSSFQQSNNYETPPPPPIKVETLESSNGIVKVKLSNSFGPLVGASVNIEGMNKGSATNQEGIATITGLDKGTYKFVFSYVGHGQPVKEITVK